MTNDKRKHRKGDPEEADYSDLRDAVQDPKKAAVKWLAGGSILGPLAVMMFSLYTDIGEVKQEQRAERDTIARMDERIEDTDRDLNARLDTIAASLTERYNTYKSELHSEATRRGQADADIRRAVDGAVDRVDRLAEDVAELKQDVRFSRFPGYGRGRVPIENGSE